MKEKVYINRVAVDYQSIYARVKDYFSRHGVQLDFTFVQSDYKNLTYRIAQFPQGQRILLSPTMSNLVPIDNSYDITSFVFNGREFPTPNIPTGYCYPMANGIFMDILTDELNPPDLDYVMICHEHMHALTYLANQKGFPTKDVMDIDNLFRQYYNNMNLESIDSNFGEQWSLLIPFTKSLTTINIPPVGSTMLYKPPNFKIEELVPIAILNTLGDKSWEMLDERMLRNLQFFRDNLGPVSVNSSVSQYRCFDPEKFRPDGTSQHNHGRACDCTFKNYTSEQVRQWIQKPENYNRLPEPNIWIEIGTPHFHFDVRYSDKKGVYFFNP